ncbi:unnamed protein product [Miscanthus lutarioriparius]|uniref:SWIM-type domain-containing protein n=1 Tax=Miscanthus lutarioriparius TaxID=422564 RepID=A0A811NFZ4_9POAL|nr:unnamed protein product [Miscanthus lutarioriparius]
MVEFIMTVDRCEHVDMALIENERQVTDEENDLQLQVTEKFKEMHVSAKLGGLEWAMEPQLGVTAAGPSRVEEEEEGDQYMEPSVDHERDDPFGVDEEWRYFRKVVSIGSSHTCASTSQQLKISIGTPHGLTIHTDACKGLEIAVHDVFQGDVEHRECFRHLMQNFRKHFDGDVLKYMWPCAWACTPRRHHWLWDKIGENCPAAIPYLQAEHKQLWSRAKFSGECKVDYVNNNISESFNNWIKETKGFPVDVLVDTIRGMIMEKIAMRQHIANKLEGSILPSVINELKMKSRNLKYTIKGSGGLKAEVSGLTKDNYPWRHAMDLESKTCSCGQWHISGKPCTHVIAFIGSLRQIKLDDYVHDYYSVHRFKDTYQFEVNPMVGKSQWPIVDLGFQMLPPKLERKRKEKTSTSNSTKAPKKSKESTKLAAKLPPSLPVKSSKRKGGCGTSKCKNASKKSKKNATGTSTSSEPPTELAVEPRKRKGGGATSKNGTGITSTSLVTQSHGTATASPSTFLAIQAPVSPGPTTRRMAASISTPTIPPGTPVSPGPITR